MGIVKMDEVKEIRVSERAGEEAICNSCIKDEEWEGIKEEEIISERETEADDLIYFCDRCKERL